MKKILALLLLFLFLPVAAWADLQVHFVDVGQGDCTVVLCDGEAMVIDGGPRSASGTVYSYIRRTLGLRHIDYVISTHPHVDHVSGLASVLNAASVDLLLTPVLEWDSKAFSSMMAYADAQGTQVAVPREGDTLQLGGATVTVLHCWPEAIDMGRTNDSSIVVRIDYGATSFILTGDAEDWSEYMMIDSGMDLKADVLRVAHHGSNTASTGEFLRAVSPEYAVISVGAGNSYGHPHAAVLDRLEEAGCGIFRTDQLGTIVMKSDGKKVSVAAPASAADAAFTMASDTIREQADRIKKEYGICVLLREECPVGEIRGFQVQARETDGGFLRSVIASAGDEQALDLLKQALASCPASLLAFLGNSFSICLVGDIIQTGSGLRSSGFAYWDDTSELRIYLDAEDLTAQYVYHELWHAAEHAAGASFDDWESLNPNGFRYTEDYVNDDAFRPEWFYREYSVTEVREDRATIYEAYYLEPEEWWEDHPLIRRKLDVMMEALPEAFGD